MAGTPATTALDRRRLPYELRSYRHDPATREYGAEAAAALGVSPRRVLKTLVAAVDAELVVAVVPVSRSLDLKALAAAVGGKRAVLTEPAQAQRATGYVVGGISPLGQRRRLRTVVDTSALEHPTVLVSGGRRGLDLELAPDALIEATGATTAAIAR